MANMDFAPPIFKPYVTDPPHMIQNGWRHGVSAWPRACLIDADPSLMNQEERELLEDFVEGFVTPEEFHEALKVANRVIRAMGWRTDCYWNVYKS